MSTAEAGLHLRKLHSAWWDAVLNKRWAAAEDLAIQIRECAKHLVQITQFEMPRSQPSADPLLKA